MRKNPRERKAVHRTDGSRPLSKGRFTRPVILSLILHSLLLIFLAINFRSFLPQSNASYPVTIAPLGSLGGGDAPTPSPAPPVAEKIVAPTAVEQTAPPAETPKPEPKKPEPEKKPQPPKDQKPDKVVTKKETVEGLKKTAKEKKAEPVQDSSYSYKDTQAKIAKMSEEDKTRPPEGKSPGGQPRQGPSPGQPGSETGTAAEVTAYTGLVDTNVKGGWVIPENLSSTKEQLETITGFFIDREGKVQKIWFIKKSGNEVYDQSTMRAIKKAEPFPTPVPQKVIVEGIGLIFNPKYGIRSGSGGRP